MTTSCQRRLVRRRVHRLLLASALFAVVVGTLAITAQAADNYTVLDVASLNSVGSNPAGVPANGAAISPQGWATRGARFGASSLGHHAFVHDGVVFRDLGTIGNYAGGSIGYGINTSNKVVCGSMSKQSGNLYQAFLWDGIGMSGLGFLGGKNSVAYDINNQNVIVGGSVTRQDVWHAFLYDRGCAISVPFPDERTRAHSRSIIPG